MTQATDVLRTMTIKYLCFCDAPLTFEKSLFTHSFDIAQQSYKKVPHLSLILIKGLEANHFRNNLLPPSSGHSLQLSHLQDRKLNSRGSALKMEKAGLSESGTWLHATVLPPPDISAVTNLPSFTSTSP